jgi:undecaprenyl-diphosphatase
MNLQTAGDAIGLGLIEGLTEFIPVSSTAHLLLAGHFLAFESTGKTFEVLIQLGAILALVAVYFSRLWQMLLDLPSDPRTQRFIAGILVAFLPAAVIGALAHDFIKNVLFESPELICTMLIVGGVILLWVDRIKFNTRYSDAMDFPLWVCLAIGFFQCLAMIPGTSRSGSTIVGAMVLGADKRSAAEFSFFLAMPTMAGAFAFDLYKNLDVLSAADAPVIAIGFVMAFLAALVVVKFLLGYVSRHGYALFGWWRLVIGAAGFAGLYLIG